VNNYFQLAKDLSEKTDRMVFDMLDKNGLSGVRSKQALADAGFILEGQSNHEIGNSETAYILKRADTLEEVDRRTVTIKGMGGF